MIISAQRKGSRKVLGSIKILASGAVEEHYTNDEYSPPVFYAGPRRAVATRAQQQQGTPTDGASVSRIQVSRKRFVEPVKEESIEVRSPGAGYLAVFRGENEPELIRVGKKLRGATRARETHGAPSSSPHDGVSIARQ